MQSQLTTQFFDETGELKWNGLIYPLRIFDIKNYTKVSSAIDEELLNGQRFIEDMNLDKKPAPTHFSMQTPGAKFVMWEKRLDFDKHPIGEADIELELQMKNSQRIINECF